MKNWIALAIVCSSPLFLGGDWLQFRGTDGSSVAEKSSVPVEFNAEKNIAWKTPLTGKGVSGPIVVGDKVYVTASSGAVKQDKLHVFCVNATTGQMEWKRDFWATGRCFHHPTSANAAPTPASDGNRIFAFYSSNDLVCLDLKGNLLWYRGLTVDFPKAGNDIGMSSSPIVSGKTVIVQVENQGDSFAAGIDTETGETLWRVDRKKDSNWVSPAIIKGEGGKETVLLQSSNGLTAHDPASGKQVWKYDVECSTIPSATVIGNRIYLPAKGLTALDVDASGTAAEFKWENNQLAPGNASPVIFGDKVYLLASRGGVLTVGSIDKGERLSQIRLKGTFWATPVLAGNHLYCANADGQVLVVDVSKPKAEVAATNEMGDNFLGSPAVAGDALYLRSDKFLYKIAEKK